MNEPTRILVIEDEPHTQTLLQVTLGQHGYQCLHASTGAAGVVAAVDLAPNTVLLDLGLPDLEGVEVTQRIRERSAVPIIILSARSQESEKIAALDSGANDYVTKPFVTGELLARIRVALRSSMQGGSSPEVGVVTVAELSIDFGLRRVTIADKEIHLTPIEYRLLGVLMRSAGRVLTHHHILQQVWGPRYATQTNYLRVAMKKLRYKIEPEPARPRYLINEAGVGYRFQAPH